MKQKVSTTNYMHYIEDHPRFRTVLSYLRTKVKYNSKVLEVGGTDASFKKYFKEFEYWMTLDNFGTPDLKIDIAKPGLKLPLENSSIDIIICTQVLEHLVQVKPFLDEVKRILNPHGFIVISVPNMLGIKSRLYNLAGIMPPMAASGDLGPDYGTHGTISCGLVVGGHVIDYDIERLYFQIKRSKLNIKYHLRTPTTFRLFGMRLKIASRIIPITLMDNIIVIAGV